MPATLTHTPLSITFDLPDYPPWSADLSDLENQLLASDLAKGLISLTHPHGSVATRSTARHYRATIRRMCRDMTSEGFDGGLQDLTYSRMRVWWLKNNHADERITRRVLQGFSENHHPLHTTLAAQLENKQMNEAAKSRPYAPYSDREWGLLVSECESIYRMSLQDRRTEVRRAESGTDPLHSGLRRANIAWLMTRLGPLSGVDLARYMGLPHKRINIQLVRDVRNALYPNPSVQIAFRTLFAVRTGMVADGVLNLKVTQIEWTDVGTSLIRYVKGRTGPQSLTLSASATRLVDSWLTLSRALRDFAPEELDDQVWISTASEAHSGVQKVVGPAVSGHNYARFVKELKLTNDTGAPLALHLSRIRATYLHRLAHRGWTGRTTIDPNHTPRVEGDFYTQQLTSAQQDSVDTLIEDAQFDLVRKAHPPVVLNTAELAAHAHTFPNRIRKHLPNDTAIGRLLSGQQDVFVGACANQLAGEWGPKGKPCPARPWVCLLCPLAVFLPRHLDNLLRLQEFFRKKSKEHPIHEFLSIYGPYAQRLDSDILPRFGKTKVQLVAEYLIHENFSLPLRPEES